MQVLDQANFWLAPCVPIAELHLKTIGIFCIPNNDSLFTLIEIIRTPRRLKPYAITDTEFSLVYVAQSFLSISLTLSTA